MRLTHRRADGSYLAIVNGNPYHIVDGDPAYWGMAQAEASELGDALPMEPPPPSPPPVDLLAYAADRRWRNEVGGIKVAGIPIATDDRAKLMITGARVAAMSDPNWSTTWHGSDGGTYPVDAVAMVMISNAVQQHVNAGFATFAAVKADIDAGTITRTDQIDAAFGG